LVQRGGLSCFHRNQSLTIRRTVSAAFPIDAECPRAGSFEEITMLRKLSLAAVAAVALGAALAPTSASAHWHGGGPGWHGGGWHGGYRWGGPRFYAPVSYGYGGCYVRRLVPTPWGPRWRLINRCY
jgi:hypothetical protein